MDDPSFQYETTKEISMRVVASKMQEGRAWWREEEMGGLKWKTSLRRQTIEDTPYFTVHLSCNTGVKREGWFADTKLCFKIRKHEEREIIQNEDEIVHFSPSNTEVAVQKFKKFSEIFDEQNGYLYGKEGNVTVVINVTIVKSGGFYKQRLCTFGTEKGEMADTILKVAGNRIAVSSQLLALHSPFFKTLFYGNFGDRNKNGEGEEEFDYELKDVDYDDFVLLLKTIYPERRKTCKRSVEGLLKLSDQLDVPEVRRHCDEYIAKTEYMTDIEKMALGMKYNLHCTMEELVSFLNDEKRLKAAVTSNKFKTLADDVKVAILEKRCALFDK